MITGFQAQLEVDDGGTGSAAAGASTRFKGLLTLNLPSLEVGTFDATELDQEDDDDNPDPYEREEPTGLIKVGTVKAEQKYTAGNYKRLQALVGKKGKTFKITTPDDQTAATAKKMSAAFVGFVKKLDELKFEKGNPVGIPVEFTVSKKPTYTFPAES